MILRRQLSAIIGRIVHHFQKLNEPAQYADVQRLQEELDQFTQSLPPHFRMKDADKSLDKREYGWQRDSAGGGVAGPLMCGTEKD